MLPTLRPHQAANRPWFIYVLRDPRDNAVRYVGWTVDPKTRLRGHVGDSKRRSHTKIARWIASLLRIGLRPTLSVIAEGIGTGWQVAERCFIRVFRMCFDLTNTTDGGEGQIGIIPSIETRMKMSVARTGRKHSAESIARMSKAQKGLKKPPTTKAMDDRMSELHPFRNKATCSSGHQFDESNTYYTIRVKNGRQKRACRKCRAARQRSYMQRKRAA